jgi:hydroxymethylpyrimidine/phosphomethylpyrimidine kinase
MRGRVPAPLVLTIAGSDPSCGAGLQADIRTFERLGVDCASVVTALTVQDGVSVSVVEPIKPALVADQLEAILASRRVAVVKCGMLARAALVRTVADVIERADVRLVVDPVLQAGGGESLGGRGLRRALAERLFPLATVVTANLPEAEAFTRTRVDDLESMERAARQIALLGPRAVVVKGGHLDGPPSDLLWDRGRVRVFPGGRRIPRQLHGTGCAFASALAAGMARGWSLSRSVECAGEHVRTILRDAARSRVGGWLRQPPGPSRPGRVGR